MYRIYHEPMRRKIHNDYTTVTIPDIGILTIINISGVATLVNIPGGTTVGILESPIQSNGVFTILTIDNEMIVVTPGVGVLKNIRSNGVTILEKIIDETVVTVPGVGVLTITRSNGMATLNNTAGVAYAVGVLAMPVQSNGGFTLVAANNDTVVVVMPGIGLLKIIQPSRESTLIKINGIIEVGVLMPDQSSGAFLMAIGSETTVLITPGVSILTTFLSGGNLLEKINGDTVLTTSIRFLGAITTPNSFVVP